MADVAFVIFPCRGRLVDLAEALRAELERQGMSSSLHEGFPRADPARLYVLVDPGRYLEAGGVLPARPILDRTLALTAQDMSGGPDAPLELLERVGRAFDVSAGAIGDLHRSGVAARLLRPGYHVEWDAPDESRERDVDVALVDVADPRRSRLLAEAADHLARHRCSIEIVSADAMDGSHRREVLRRARIALQLHAGQGDRLDWLHAVDAMHAGAVVVAEHSTDLGPFDPGRHLFVSSAAALPWVIDDLLADPGRLERTRREAGDRLREWLPFAVSVGVLRAALLEMLGRPLDRSGDEGRLLPTADGDRGEEASVIAELRRTRIDLLDVRRSLSHLQASVGGSTSTVDRTELAVNDAWNADDERPLAVMLTVGDDGAAATATLDALWPACEEDVELVIADAGDATPEVTEWLDAHRRLPVARVSGAPGLAASRTAALGLIRAPACLVLDAGTVPYPRCVEALRESLALGPALVSAIQAVRPAGGGTADDRSPAPPPFLRGAEAGELAGPLLAPTAALVDAGGFVSQAVSEGVRGDDLWARLSLPRRRVAEILSLEAPPRELTAARAG